MEIIEETVREEWFKKIIHQVAEDELDEDEWIDDESCINKGKYIVEYTYEVQHMGLRDDYFGDEREFNNLDDALDFYSEIDEPDEYTGVYDSDGFRWR